MQFNTCHHVMSLQQQQSVRHNFCITYKYAYVANLPYTLCAGVPGKLPVTVLSTGEASSRFIHLVACTYHTYTWLVLISLSSYKAKRPNTAKCIICSGTYPYWKPAICKYLNSPRQHPSREIPLGVFTEVVHLYEGPLS